MMKRARQSGSDWYEGLAILRNTPVADGLPTPAKLLQGRALRDSLPVAVKQYQVSGYELDKVRELLGARQASQKYYHDNHAGPEKPMLTPGQQVHFKTAKGTWVSGEIIDIIGDRSYRIGTENRQSYVRNSIDIRKSSVAPRVETMRAESTKVRPELDHVDSEPEIMEPAVNTGCDQVSDNRSVDIDHEQPAVEISPKTPLRSTRSGRVIRQPVWRKDYV